MNPFETKKATREHLVELTKELVRFPSHVHEPLKIFELVDYIKGYFEKEKVHIKTHVYNGLPSLVITLEETKHPDILLSGHIDVVPSSTRYTPEEDGDWLYGSGAMDMKGGVAVMMALLKYFSRQSKRPSLGLMITSDEEIGGEHGTASLLSKEEYRAHLVIINEGRGKYDLIVREKGILILKIIAHGDFTHSAYSWRGVNALESLMEVLMRFKKLFRTPKDKWISTGSVTVLHAGRETNTIPGYAEAIMNVRLTGGFRWSKAALLKRMRSHLPKNIEVVEMGYSDVFLADPRNENIQLLREAAQEVMGKKVRFADNHGGSDAKIFQQHNIPTAILGPVGKDHHTPNEAVSKESLFTHFEVLKRFIEKNIHSFISKRPGSTGEGSPRLANRKSR